MKRHGFDRYKFQSLLEIKNMAWLLHLKLHHDHHFDYLPLGGRQAQE